MTKQDAPQIAKHQLSGRGPTVEEQIATLSKRVETLNSELAEQKRHYAAKYWQPSNVNIDTPLQQYNEIIQSADKILGYRLEDFYSEKVSGDDLTLKYFENQRWAIKEVLATASTLKGIPQPVILQSPIAILHQIVERSERIVKCLRTMRDVSSSPHNRQESANAELRKRRDDCISEFNAAYRDFFDATYAIESVARREELNLLKEQVLRLTDKETKEGIRKHTSLYKAQVRQHFFAGLFWLVAGISVLLLTLKSSQNVSTEILDILNKPPQDRFEILISYLSVRVVVFGLLSSVVFWCFKNYRLNKHNELINQQRRMALDTFPEFANAAGIDNAMRGVILSKVTSTIFDVQPLGYVEDDKEPSLELSARDILERAASSKA